MHRNHKAATGRSDNCELYVAYVIIINKSAHMHARTGQKALMKAAIQRRNVKHLNRTQSAIFLDLERLGAGGPPHKVQHGAG
jgi:hypothetical protein